MGRLVTAVIGIATIRFSTAMLPPEQFGALAVLITFQTFCGLFLVNPVGQYINRQTHTWTDEGSLIPRLRRYRVWVFWAALVGALASGGWALSQPMSWGERIIVSAMVLIMVVAATANATSVSLLNMLGYRALAAGWAGATALLGLSFSMIFTHSFGGGLVWFAGQALGMAIGALGATRAVRQLLPVSREAHWRLLEPGVLRTYVLPLAISTGFMWWLLSGYRLLLEAHWGLAALGGAVVGLSLAAQLWGLLETLAMQFLYPMFYRRIAVKDSPDSALAFSDLLNTLGPVYLVMLAATAVAAPSLLALFVDVGYANVVPFVLLGAVIECSRALGNVLGTAAQVERRMVALIVPSAVGALTLTAGLLLINVQSGIFEAVLILASAGLLTLITMAIVMSRLQRFYIDWARWCGAVAVVLCAIALVKGNLLVPDDMAKALTWVALTGILAGIATVALLWKNPGTERLLAVRLQSTPGEELTS